MSSTARLRALHGTPLDDGATRRTVESTARALAEREGIELLAVEVAPDGITITVDAERIVGLGFVAELRRVTNKWYEDKYRDGPLWGTPLPGTEFEFD
ncbi:MAG: hypothetical protein KF805_16820 [Phycisphaeraceae bacterium]|nr:hypothetical protein [Phycisphaeraceae bacterium]